MKDRVLIVDDSSINLSILKGLIEKLGLKADCKKDPAAALQMLSKHEYKVILSDYLMPGMNGVEFTYKVHDREGFENLPVILLTSDFSDEEYLMFIEAGINNVLIKPVSFDLLKDALSPYTENIAEEAEEKTPELDSDYLNLVKVFVESAAVRYEAIERFYGDKDYNSFTVEVHAVKGEAAMISESELSARALELEQAGKALLGITPSDRPKEDLVRIIDENTPGFLDMLYGTLKRLNALFPDDGQSRAQTSADTKKLDKALRYTEHAIEALDEGDHSLAREWLVEIKGLLS